MLPIHIAIAAESKLQDSRRSKLDRDGLCCREHLAPHCSDHRCKLTGVGRYQKLPVRRMTTEQDESLIPTEVLQEISSSAKPSNLD